MPRIDFALMVAAMVMASGGDAATPSKLDIFTQNMVSAGRKELGRSSSDGFRYAEMLKHEADKQVADKRSVLLATADWVQAVALDHVNKPALSLSFSSRGIEAVRALEGASELKGHLLLEKANAESALGYVQDALINYQEAYKSFTVSGASRGQAVALQDLAAIYIVAGDNISAYKYSKQALEAYSADSILQLSAYNNQAIALIGLKRFVEAEAKYYQAFQVAEHTRNNLLQVRVLDNLARAQLDQGKTQQASETIQKAELLASDKAASFWIPAVQAVKAKLALKQGRLESAGELIEQALRSASDRPSTFRLRDFYETAYQINRAKGETGKALDHLEAFKKLDDQDRALAASTNAALMSARFDFANQDLKIVRLRAGQAERDAALARTQGRFHSALIGGLAFISVLLALGFVSIRRSRNQVRDANRELQGTNAELEKALAAKSTFLATTSHEIRTPLNGILGMTQVLLANRAVEPEVRSRVQLIHGAGETMRALVDDILDMAKMETGELKLHPAPMDLRRLLEEAGAVWTGQAQTKGIGLTLHLDECPAGIVADEVRLRQIVFNLMSNAIKFTDRGRVSLSARAESRDDGEALVLVVEDSGIGIPPDRLAEIFESFRQVDGGVTRRHGGTGLGLAICRNLARAMGGDVGVASVPGTGSSFTVDLPLQRAQMAPAAAQPRIATTAQTLAEARLLILEPNPLAQGILRALVGPRVRALEVAGDEEAAAALLAAGDVQHLLADAAAFAFDPAACLRFVGRHGVAHVTVLWPSPDDAVRAAFAADPAVRLLAKPIAAPDLLAALRMGYDGPTATRDIAA